MFNPIGFNPFASNNNLWNAGGFGSFGLNSNPFGMTMPGMPMNFPGMNFANTSQNVATNAMNIRSGAEALRGSLHSMMGIGRDNTSPFAAMKPTSGNTDLMTIIATDPNRLRNTNTSDFSVQVVNVAQAQRNEGANLEAAALATEAGFTQGANQMSLNVGGRQFDFSFNVTATDTVRDVQQRIASAVNSRNIGVSASVVFDQEAGTSALNLHSRDTGVDREGQPNFTVSGGGVSVLGVGNITQQAENAQFRVNRGFTGALQTSRSNDVNLGNGITARLHDVGDVDVTMARDVPSQIDSVRDMVNNFNRLMRDVRGDDNSARRNVTRLEQQLTGLVVANAAGLERVGITVGRDGMLSINNDRLQSAAESGSLERFMTDGGTRGSFGFINRLERTVDNAIRNPASFIRETSSMPQFNSRQMIQMNQLMHTGMLFNSWF